MEPLAQQPIILFTPIPFRDYFGSLNPIPLDTKFIEVKSAKFHTPTAYLKSLFDKHAIYDFEKGILDLAKAMNEFVQATKVLTKYGKSQFAKKAKSFAKTHPSSKANSNGRYYLTPSNMTSLLDERVQRMIATTSESFKNEVAAKVSGDDKAFEGSKIFYDSRLDPLLLQFRSLFNPRVEISFDPIIFMSGNLEGFESASEDEIYGRYFYQILGIIHYCQSCGFQFAQDQLDPFLKAQPENFEPKPVLFGAPELVKPRGSSLLIKVLVVIGIFGLLTAAIVRFIIYKKKKEPRIANQ